MAPHSKRAQVRSLGTLHRYGVLNGIISRREKQNVETVTVTGMVSVRVLSRIQTTEANRGGQTHHAHGMFQVQAPTPDPNETLIL